MKYCQHHWGQLRAAVESRGMGHLIAKSGQEAVSRMKAELDGHADPRSFDPLMACHNRVLERALEIFGLAILQGDLCPVCELIDKVPDSKGRTREQLEKHYSDELAESCLEYCLSEGLVKSQ